MTGPPTPAHPAARVRFTRRLRLEPIGPAHARDLWELHAQPDVALWHAGTWGWAQAHRNAERMGGQWAREGIGKWMAYPRGGAAVAGRGGLSWAQVAGARRLEVGWTVHPRLWGRGLATEIGARALAVAFTELGRQR